MFIEYNPNPKHRITDDCTIRAIAKITGQNWDDTYIGLCVQGFEDKALPNTNFVWSQYLADRGFKQCNLPDYCPYCYTVKDFCKDHQDGTFLLYVGSHVIAVVDGNYYDTWDSGDEVPLALWTKEDI